jgi:hypothetical protein
MNETELSKYIWKLKQNGRHFTWTWSILRHAAPYSSGGKQCSLCTEDKLCILKANKKLVLNSRSEIFTKCQHQKRFLAGNYGREYDYGRTRKMIMYMQRQQARSNVSKHQRTGIQKLKSVAWRLPLRHETQSSNKNILSLYIYIYIYIKMKMF